jgi:hypothetical protein
MSQSKLKPILKSVEKFYHLLNFPRKPTYAQIVGTATHILILQPHLAHTIIEKPSFNATTREGKIFNFILEGKSNDFFPVREGKIKKQLEGQFYEISSEEEKFIFNIRENYSRLLQANSDSLFLKSEDYDKVHKMAEAVRANADAAYILSCCTAFEKVYKFDYKGIGFKAQLDGEGDEFVLDFKTTLIENDDWEIEREIKNRLYDFQAACYLQGSQKKDYFFIFVRNEAPYEVFPIHLSWEKIFAGREKFDLACDKLNHCLQHNPTFKPNNRLRMI